jgi:hypothetical protein
MVDEVVCICIVKDTDMTPFSSGIIKRISEQHSCCWQSLNVTLYGHIVCDGGQTPIARDTGRGLSFAFSDLFYNKGLPNKGAAHGYAICILFF